MSQREITHVSEDDCWNLLTQKVVGRVVFNVEDGPIAIPVNYGVGNNEIVFRTTSDAEVLNHLDGTIAFQVDDIHPDEGSGWSVLVRGTAVKTNFEQLPDLIHGMHGSTPKPWAEGVHNAWVVVRATQISGRRLAGEVAAW